MNTRLYRLYRLHRLYRRAYKLSALILALCLISCGSAPESGVPAEAVPRTDENAPSIDDAIRQVAQKIEERLPGNTRLAIVNVSSPSAVFSDYVIEELAAALQENSSLTVVDRNILHLALAQAELNFQMSGDVSEETQESIGHMLGAQSILSASLLDVGDTYRFRAAVIKVETMARQTTSSLDVRKDRRIDFLLTAESPEERKSTANPVTAYDFRRRGHEYIDNSEYGKAIDDYSQAIRLNPQDADAYFSRGSAYYRLSAYTDAIDDFTEVIRLNPGYGAVYNNRGTAFADRGRQSGNANDYSRALDDLLLALEIRPQSSNTNGNIGSVYLDLKDYGKALSYLDRSIALNPRHYAAYNLRADVYYALGDKANALKNLEKAFFNAPPDDTAIRLKYESFRDKGEWIYN